MEACNLVLFYKINELTMAIIKLVQLNDSISYVIFHGIDKKSEKLPWGVVDAW